MPLAELQAVLCGIFERRNKPGAFRVDNGEPFGSPHTDTPPPLALWLIGHDVDMIWNKPYCPQMNGVVEHLQDTSARWVDLDTCPSGEVLQRRLEEEAHIQRSLFPVTRLQGLTRLQAFPALEKSNRIWKPEEFCSQRVYAFLAKKIFPRKVSSGGQITHFGQKFSVGMRLKGQVVQLKLNDQTLEWEVYDDYKIVKKHSALPMLGDERILNLSVYQRTKVESLGRI